MTQIFHNYTHWTNPKRILCVFVPVYGHARERYYAVKYHLLISFIARRVTINYSVYFDVWKLRLRAQWELTITSRRLFGIVIISPAHFKIINIYSDTAPCTWNIGNFNSSKRINYYVLNGSALLCNISLCLPDILYEIYARPGYFAYNILCTRA